MSYLVRGTLAFLIGLTLAWGLNASLARAQDAAYVTMPVLNEIIDQTNFEVDGKCSGTLISLEQRLVLTARHCVTGGVMTEEKEIEGEDGELKKKKFRKFETLVVTQYIFKDFQRVRTVTYDADIVAMDDDRDLAVVKILSDIPNTIASPVAKKNPTRGDKVWIVGNPQLEYASLMPGMVASVQRQVEVGGGGLGMKKRDALQIAGGLIPGHSGGAIYNTSGEIVGVNHATGGYYHLGYVIPASSINVFMEANKAKLAGEAKPAAPSDEDDK